MRSALVSFATVLAFSGCSGSTAPPPARDASTARSGSQPAPEAPPDAPDPRPSPADSSQPTVANSDACVDGVAPPWTPPAPVATSAPDIAACSDAFRRDGDRIARTPSRRWAAPALRALARCALLPAALRDGATAAARSADPAARAAKLAEAAASALPLRCHPADPAAPATAIAGCCPAPGDLPSVDAAPPVDAGTWSFTVAVWRTLEAAGAADQHARRIIDELCQSIGLEGVRAPAR